MNKMQGAVVLVVFLAIASAASLLVYKSVQPATTEEFNEIDDLMDELNGYMDFENQTFDYDLGEISGDWG